MLLVMTDQKARCLQLWSQQCEDFAHCLLLDGLDGEAYLY